MYRTDANLAAPTKPARPAAVETPGYFQNGTDVDYGFLNDLMDEIAYAVQGQGYSLDRNDPQQLLAAIRAGMKSSRDPIGSTTTDHLIGLLLSEICDIDGSYNLIVASTGSSITADVTYSVVAGCDGCVTNHGKHLATLASEDCTISLQNGHGRAAVLAAANCSISLDGAIAADQSAIAASDGCSIVGADNCAVIGSTDSSVDSQTKNHVVILASDGVVATTHGTTPAYSVIGGAGGEGWRLESSTGRLYLSDVVHASGLDFAELFENIVAGALLPGTLVTRVGRKVKRAMVGDEVLGVVSRKPTILGGCGLQGFDPQAFTPVGLLGQLEVLVDLDVRVGDYLKPGRVGVARRTWFRKTRIQVMEIVSPGIALCLVR